MMLGLWPKIWMLSVVAFLFANANSREDLEVLYLDDGYPSHVMYVDELPNINWKLEESPFIRIVAVTKSQENQEEQEKNRKDEKNIPEAEHDAAENERGKEGKRSPRSVKKVQKKKKTQLKPRLFYPWLSRGHRLRGRHRHSHHRRRRRRRRSGWRGK